MLKKYFFEFLLLVFPLAGFLSILGHSGVSDKLVNLNFLAVLIVLVARLSKR